MSSVLTDHISTEKKTILQSLRARRRMSLIFAESGFTKAHNMEIKNSMLNFLESLKRYLFGLYRLILLACPIPFYC